MGISRKGTPSRRTRRTTPAPSYELDFARLKELKLGRPVATQKVAAQKSGIPKWLALLIGNDQNLRFAPPV